VTVHAPGTLGESAASVETPEREELPPSVDSSLDVPPSTFKGSNGEVDQKLEDPPEWLEVLIAMIAVEFRISVSPPDTVETAFKPPTPLFTFVMVELC
jgi:hypothetical protein